MALEVNIKKKFLDFELEIDFMTQGNSMGMLGASGSGKSMTLKCIAGIEDPDEGRIVLDGIVLFDSKQKINLPPQKRNVGYLFQNYALFPTMTVEENIGIGVKGSKEVRLKAVQEQVKRFHLEGLEKRLPRQLSGGQQQRVALARILAYNPQIIMLDEPFSALDSFLKDLLHKELLEVLSDYHGEIILVSHSRDEIFKFCNDLIIMDHGKVSVRGNTRELFKNPKNIEAAKVTGCKNISRIRRLNTHQLEAIDWGIALTTENEINENITHVGIRARHLLPSKGKSDINIMKVKFIQSAETPFDVQYMIRNAQDILSQEVWWIKPKRQMDSKSNMEIPKYISFPPNQLMLLES